MDTITLATTSTCRGSSQLGGGEAFAIMFMLTQQQIFTCTNQQKPKQKTLNNEQLDLRNGRLTYARTLHHLLSKFIVICKVDSVRHTSTCHTEITTTHRSQYCIEYGSVTFKCDKVMTAMITCMYRSPCKPQ